MMQPQTEHDASVNHEMAAGDLLDDLLHDDRHPDGKPIPTGMYLPDRCAETAADELLCEANIAARAAATADEIGAGDVAKRLAETALERLTVLMELDMGLAPHERIETAEWLINSVAEQAQVLSDALGQRAVAETTRYAKTQIPDGADAAAHLRAALLSRRVKQDNEAWQQAELQRRAA